MTNKPLRIVIEGIPGMWTPDESDEPTLSEALDQAVALIAEFEGFRENAYKDPVGIWTIGFGHTQGVTQNSTITREEAYMLLWKEAEGFLEGVKSQVDVALSSGQLAALTSFAYNLGLGALGNSTLLRKLNESDYKGAEKEFARWVYAGGKVLRGLQRRRAREAELFRTN